MTQYVWRQISHHPGYDEPFEVDGEIVPGTVQSADPHSTRLIALVRIADDGTSRQSTGDSDEVYQCGTETASGTCSREVDNPEGSCWQHD